MGNPIQGDGYPDVISLISALHHQHSELKGELVAALLWVTWNVSNKLLFKGVFEDPVRLVAKAVSVVDSVKRIKQAEHVFSAGMIPTKQVHWCPPGEGWLKINVDAAVDGENELAGLGAVIRNYEGEVVAAVAVF